MAQTSRIFPIKIEPACLLKWSWSTIYFNSGTSASCHRTKRYEIDPYNFNNFHNLPEKTAARKLMLDGQWPQAGCQYCQHIEEAGGISDRQYQLDLQGDICQHPPELNLDPVAVEVTPTILEVYFKNTCNMACVYCGPHFSSRWEDENKKFKSNFNNSLDKFNVQSAQTNLHYDKMVNDLWEYLKTNDRYKILRRFHILGGEPFIIPELDAAIDFWDQFGNMNLVFSIISNLNIPHNRFKQYITKFKKLINEKKIWKIEITASLDAWGEEQKYTRHGLDLTLWEKNFEFLVNQQWVTLSINSAISALTIKQLPALIEKINYWNSMRGPEIKNIDNVVGEPIYHSFNTTNTYDDLYIFGKNIFDHDFDKILQLMPVDNEIHRATKLQMQSIASTLKKSTIDYAKIKELKNYLTLLDQRRKTNWKETFPWLINIEDIFHHKG